MATPNSAEAGEAETKAGAANTSKWLTRKKLWAILGVVALLVVIGLAVGLGVGLTRHRGGDGDGDDDSSDSDESGSGPDRNRKKWKPGVGDSWQIVLQNSISVKSKDDIDPDVAVYDLDLYENDKETFRILQDAGKKVICYFSAGSWEKSRSDKNDFADSDLGNVLDGWPDERWLKLDSSTVRDVMKKRIKMAWQKGCDAIDPDNVDGYQNDNGLDLTAQNSIDFIKFLSDEADSYGMAVGLKNSGSIISKVLDKVDFSVNEQCIQFSECETFAAFVKADKPVFNIEYPDGAPDSVPKSVVEEICSHKGNSTGTEGFSTVIKTMDLDGWVEYCGGKEATTKLQ